MDPIAHSDSTPAQQNNPVNFRLRQPLCSLTYSFAMFCIHSGKIGALPHDKPQYSHRATAPPRERDPPHGRRRRSSRQRRLASPAGSRCPMGGGQRAARSGRPTPSRPPTVARAEREVRNSCRLILSPVVTLKTHAPQITNYGCQDFECGCSGDCGCDGD